jgi:hypothetical protein
MQIWLPHLSFTTITSEHNIPDGFEKSSCEALCNLVERQPAYRSFIHSFLGVQSRPCDLVVKIPLTGSTALCRRRDNSYCNNRRSRDVPSYTGSNQKMKKWYLVLVLVYGSHIRKRKQSSPILVVVVDDGLSSTTKHSNKRTSWEFLLALDDTVRNGSAGGIEDEIFSNRVNIVISCEELEILHMYHM